MPWVILFAYCPAYYFWHVLSVCISLKLLFCFFSTTRCFSQSHLQFWSHQDIKSDELKSSRAAQDSLLHGHVHDLELQSSPQRLKHRRTTATRFALQSMMEHALCHSLFCRCESILKELLKRNQDASSMLVSTTCLRSPTSASPARDVGKYSTWLLQIGFYLVLNCPASNSKLHLCA